MTKDIEVVSEVHEVLGYYFQDRELLLQALTHKSYTNEAGDKENCIHNERLEFLGDAILNLVVSEMLMSCYSDADEGELSRMRAALVNEKELSETADRFCLGDLLRLGKGEEKDGGRSKKSLLADLFEALLAAVYLDGGLEAARQVVELSLGAQIEESKDKAPGFDPKSQLQVLLQQRGQPTPSYLLIEKTGPEHRRRFTVSVVQEDRVLGQGMGRSKKEAEQAAAQYALSNLLPEHNGGQPN